MPKGDKIADTELAGLLEVLQEQNRALQEQHNVQQKLLLDLIEQQRVAHKREIKTLTDTAVKPPSEPSNLSPQSQHCKN